MPVPTEKIKGRFKVLFPGLNLSSERLAAIASKLALKLADDASDSDVDKVINEANEVFPFSEIAKADDRVRNAEAEANKLKNPKPPKTETEEEKKTRLAAEAKTKEDEKKMGEAPDWFKTFAEGQKKEIDDLKEQLSNQSKEGKVNANTGLARALFDKHDVFSKVDDKNKDFWFSQLKVTDATTEEEINTQLESLKEQHGSITQSKADATTVTGPPPAHTKADAKMNKEEAKDLAKDIVG